MSFSHLSQVSEIELFHINLFLCFRETIADITALQFRVRNTLVTASDCVYITQVNSYGNVKENILFTVSMVRWFQILTKKFALYYSF